MRARDMATLGALRLISAAIKQIEVDERIIVDDARLLIILDKLSKQRQESIHQFQAAHREDLVQQEQFELDLIHRYLPEPLTEAQITHLIQQTLSELEAKTMADMGRVMAHLKPQMQGRADMSRVSALIKAQLL